MDAQDHPDALAIDGITSQHWFTSEGRWHAVIYDEHTGQEYDVRQTPFGWNVNDDQGKDHHRHEFADAIESARFGLMSTDVDGRDAFTVEVQFRDVMADSPEQAARKVKDALCEIRPDHVVVTAVFDNDGEEVLNCET